MPAGNLTAFLETWLTRGGTRIGQVSLRPEAGGGWSLMHGKDRTREPGGSPPKGLEIFTNPEDARGIALKDEAGSYRPLKSAPNLRRGWELRLPDVPAVRLALDFLYPAALGNRVAWGEQTAPPDSLRDMLNRQTGMYRVTGLAQTGELQAVIAQTCEPHTKCLRKIVWEVDRCEPVTGLPREKFLLPGPQWGTGPELPVLCTDACPLLIGAIRETVSRRRREEKGAAASAAALSPDAAVTQEAPPAS